jgi:Transposase DDE domain
LQVLFQELLPESFLQQIQIDNSIKRNNCVYTPRVTMWLMLAQRLRGGASLETGVLELRTLPDSFWSTPCKRLRQWREHGKPLSSYTGAYNLARQALPQCMVERSCDRMFEQLVTKMDPAGQDRRAFVFDGSTIRTAHTPELCAAYPPGSNQYGEGHWPMIRVLVAHDVHTGLAMRPHWGPMHGPHAVSEQGLLEQAIDQLPSGSTVMGDANFGVFSVAYTATQRQHPVLLRLTPDRCRRLAGEAWRDGIDREVVWKPSRAARKSHPDLPADACVSGRLMVRQVQPDNGAAPFLLALFTTLPSEEAFPLYGQRWAIETDLRTLKSTLCLEQLTCLTPEMVAKEIEIAIAAYNLIRAMIAFASQQSGIPPRGYSFTKVRHIVEAFASELAQAPNPQAAKRIFDEMMTYIQQAKLPRRKRKRPSYPRAVWARRGDFPKRKK